jgi:hypothetical protein
MIIPAINYIAVLLAAVSSVIVGSIWYAKPVFGKRWMRLSGVTDETMLKNPVLLLVITFVVSSLTALVLAGVTWIATDYEGNFLLVAILTGAILWIGFTAARLLTHDLFERRPSSLTVLNMAHELVTILVMALIIGVWPPF